jgi:hypothetical protein
MDFHNHEKTQALVERYLDPATQWTPNLDKQMRGSLRSCDDCADHYSRSVTLHRMMVGADAEAPSGFERERMMTAVVDDVAKAKAKQPFWVAWRLPALAGALAAAAVVIIVVGNPTQKGADAPPADEYIGSRGGTHVDSRAHLDMSGVSEVEECTAGNVGCKMVEREYEVKETALYLGDALKLYTKNTDEKLHYFMIVGVQRGSKPVFLAPHPDMNTDRSLALKVGERLPVTNPADADDIHGVLFPLKALFSAGQMTLVTLFTQDALTRGAVERVLADAHARTDLGALLRDKLQLNDNDIIQAETVDMALGSKVGTTNE